MTSGCPPRGRSTRPRLLRRISAVALATCALLLSGCVYLRLYELKKQIERFDEFFGLQTSDGLVLRCNTPVLKTGDVRWIGLKPESVRTLGSAEQWQLRWVKESPGGVTERIEYDIVLELGFANDRLTRVKIPERGSRGGRCIRSGSGGSTARARAGRPSVARLT